MRYVNPVAAARGAITAVPARPASAIVHDSPDSRLVVFRIEPGQEVSAHRSTSTVVLNVLEGSGILSGADGEQRSCSAGDIVLYEPNEEHSMRASEETLLILATITPRPGTR